MDERMHSERKPYTAPSVELLGSLSELTLTPTNPNGCFGNGQDKNFTHTDGNGMAETGCVVS